MKKAARSKYRLRNWREYNAALKQRGSLTVRVSPEAIAGWTSEEKTGARGASPPWRLRRWRRCRRVTIARAAAARLLTIALRLDEAGVERDRTLDARAPPQWRSACRSGSRAHPRHLVVDSTGVKVHGEGEWKVRQHGVSQRRPWLKLHLCVAEATPEIVSAVASTSNISDAEVLADLLADVEGEVVQVSADGASDQRKCYDALNQRSSQGSDPSVQRRTDLAARQPSWRDATTATRMCGVSEKQGASDGRRKATTIAEAGPKRQSFASTLSAEIGSKRAGLKTNSKIPYSSRRS